MVTPTSTNKSTSSQSKKPESTSRTTKTSQSPKKTKTTTKKEEPVAEVIEIVPEVEEEIQPLFYNGFFPVYALTDKDTIDKIRDMNLPICFLLGRVESKGNTPGTSVFQDGLIQMMNGPFSYGLTKVAFSALDIAGTVKESASLKTPRLPWQFVAKMDMFFRAVHEKYDTEGIVQLTYDMDKLNSEDPGSGWDYYVPTQTNTSSACDYSKDEILEYLEGTNMILAGSAHSHPEMGAFFSDTDHKDQADWPGLHITFAWAKGSKKSNHHIELVQNGKRWSYDDPSAVFEEPPAPTIEVDFAKVLEEKVSEKKYTQTTVVTSGYTQKGGAPQGGPKSNYPGGQNRSWPHTGPAIKQPTILLPSHAPDVRDNVIVAVVEKGFPRCMFCNAPTTPKMNDYSSCYACGGLFMMDYEDIDELIKQRQKFELDVSLLDGSKKLPVWTWRPSQDDKTEDSTATEFELVLDPTGGDADPKG